ncbi:MAG TPA: RNA-binding protein [Polyangiaceae bacterium]
MSARLFVGNLSLETTPEALRDTFAPFGEVTDVHVIVDRYSGRPRGFAFVTMGSSAQAVAAMQKLNGALIDGRPLRVNEAEARRH